MKKYLIVSALAVCLAGSGLFAQAEAPAASQPPAAQPAPAAPAAGQQGGGQQAGAQPAAGQQAATSSSEDEFFGSADVEAKQGAAEKANAAEAVEVEKEKLGFSGELQSLSAYTMTRNFVAGVTGIDDNTFANSVLADFLVDARLPKSYRMFMDLNVNYVPTGVPVPETFTGFPASLPPTLTLVQNQSTLLDIKEVFVDFNFANTVYFRAGKQVLQWGTGYFWNPTDLINVSHKSFTNLNALLDGVFGLRGDVTFSSAFHLYTFINLNDVQDLTDVA